MRHWCVSLSVLALSCGSSVKVAKTAAEGASGYTYVPIDPMAVETVPGSSCEGGAAPRPEDLLATLPDNAVRMSVERFEASGNVSFGIGTTTAEGSRYRVTTDFINADTVSVRLWVRKLAELYDPTTKTGSGKFESVPLDAPLTTRHLLGSERFQVLRASESAKLAPAVEKDFEEIWLPTYVGVGLRVTARVSVLESGAEISGLGAIGAAAEGSYLTGDLVVQTLGINGPKITPALPIQSDLNQTTVMNAVVSVSSIKTLLHEAGTHKSPRLVGLYLPLAADQRLVNAIISALSRERVTWRQPCRSAGGQTPPPG